MKNTFLFILGLLILNSSANAQLLSRAQTVTCDYLTDGLITPMTVDEEINSMGGVTYFNGVDHYFISAISMRSLKGQRPYTYEATGVVITISGPKQSRPIRVSTQEMIPGQPVEARSSNNELIVSCYLPI